MNSYYINNNRIYFKVSYDPNFVTEVKEITGRTWDADNKIWHVPNNFVNVPQVQALIQKYNIQNLPLEASSPNNGTNVLGEIEDVIEERLPYYLSKLSQVNWHQKPRPYQVIGIVYSLIAKKIINGSDMGTGKTFTSIFAIELEELFPCVVVVPASVKYNWQMQWKRVNPDRTVSVIESDKSDFTADVIIMTYKSVGKKEKYVSDKGEDKERIIFKFEELSKLKPKSFIADESQNLKNGKALQSAAVRKLVRGIDYRFLLTGTSIMNRPDEIINPLVTLGQFDPLFGNWYDFVYKYCGAEETRFGMDTSGATNTLELNHKLRQACYFRVEKREVLTELPDREETILEVDIDNRKEYDTAERDLISYLKDNFGQLKADSALYAEQLVMISTLSNLAAKGKMSSLHEWIDNFMESSNSKLVVFGIHTEFIKSLAKKYDCDMIIGEVGHKNRQQIVDDFQVNNKRILFMNILTGSVGIDGLQKVCNDMLIYELPWRWTDIEQAISRLERDAQKNNINVYFMLGKETIDMDIWRDVLMPKREVTDSVNKGVDVDTQTFMSKFISKFTK